MKATKTGNKITIELTPDESESVDYFIEQRGQAALDEYFGHFIRSRVSTKRIEERRSLLENVTPQEKRNILGRGKKNG